MRANITISFEEDAIEITKMLIAIVIDDSS
jgi:hypothetical protein